MRIERVHIDRFGKFEEASFGPFQSGLNIVEGPNEAGKTTLLSFLRYTFFGFPRSKTAPFRTKKGSGAGGRIEVRKDDDALLSFERNEGSKGGPFRLHYSDGTISEDEGDRLNLLGNADEHLFQNIYAFTLDELTDAAVLDDERLMERIMGAGYGTKGVSPEAVRKKLQEQAESRYKKRKQTAEFNELKEAIEEKEKAIEEREKEQARYSPLLQELKEAREQKEKLRQQEEEKERELDRIQRALALIPDFNRHEDALEILQRLGEKAPIDSDDDKQLEEALQKKEEKKEELEELKKSLERIDQELKELSPEEDLLSRESAIRELAEQRALFNADLQERNEALRRKREAEERLKERSKDLSLGLGEEELWNMEGLDEVKERVQSFSKDFEALLNREQQYDARLSDRGVDDRLRAHHYLFIGAIVLLGIGLGVGLATSYPLLVVFTSLALGSALLGAIALRRDQKHKDPIEAERERMEKERKDLEKRWKEWLERFAFPKELHPEAALERLQRIDELVGILRKKEEERKNIEFREQRLGGLKQEVQRLQGKDAIDEEEVPSLIRGLVDRVEEAKKQKGEKKNLEAQRQELAQKKEQLENAIERADDTVKTLLQKAGVEDIDRFREKVKENAERDRAEMTKKESLERIEDRVGKGKAEELIAFLRKWDKAQLEEQERKLDEELNDLKEQRESWAQKEAVLEQEKSTLEAKRDPTVLKNQREALWAQLRASYKDWVAERLGIEVLDRVRERYEREQQPALVQKASEHFEYITNGRYTRIRIPVGSDEDREVRVYDRKGAATELGSLSRGTREQLLLSVRMAFVDEYEKRREALPVVMDEVLVNFDRERAEASAKALEAFAKGRQVLLFTCHEGVRDLFSEGVPHFRLERG